MWVYIIEGDDSTFPEEGLDVIVSDGTHFDVAYYIRSGEYVWLKEDILKDCVSRFKSFIPTKWNLIYTIEDEREKSLNLVL